MENKMFWLFQELAKQIYISPSPSFLLNLLLKTFCLKLLNYLPAPVDVLSSALFLFWSLFLVLGNIWEEIWSKNVNLNIILSSL